MGTVIDITEYPGVVKALNQILNSGEEAVIRVEGESDISVAKHIRIWLGTYELGKGEPKKRGSNYGR